MPTLCGCRSCYAVGVAGEHAVLALEWLDLRRASPTRRRCRHASASGSRRSTESTAPTFGWRRDNTIGATPQPNDSDDGLAALFRVAPRPSTRSCCERGLDRRVLDRGLQLSERCGEFFAGYRPVPSLLHGDLWGGNWSALASTREPVVFDPAVYFGDREADLAFTRLFGGFGPAFYAAYELRGRYRRAPLRASRSTTSTTC